MKKIIAIIGLITMTLVANVNAAPVLKTAPVLKESVSKKDAASVKTQTSKQTATSKTAAPAAATASLMNVESTPEEIDSGSVGKGASLSPLLSESFQTDLATGSATAGVPIVVPPGRKNMQPSLGLSYSSNNPDGVCGVGWGLTSSSIQRSAKKGMPKYDATDTFVFSSNGSNGDLVLINAVSSEYRQKIETGFMKYVFDSANSKWTVWDKAGVKYTFGSSVASRILNSDGTKTFEWFLDRVEDVYGNGSYLLMKKTPGKYTYRK